MRRTLAIGDVHGCLEELRELLAAAAYREGVDRLVFVGDLVDRGPDPVGVVREVRKLSQRGDVLTVMGNHEEKLVRWLKRVHEERTQGKKNAMTPPDAERLAQWDAFDAEDRAWLAERPITAEAAPGWTVVHGGFESTESGAQNPQKMLRCRWVDPETGKMIALAEPSAPRGPGALAEPSVPRVPGALAEPSAPRVPGALAEPSAPRVPGALAARRRVFWMERWRGPAHVVYGHAVHSLESPRVDRPAPGVECWGIDTGCCFGGRLTALCLETREITQVPARRAYAELRTEALE